LLIDYALTTKRDITELYEYRQILFAIKALNDDLLNALSILTPTFCFIR